MASLQDKLGATLELNAADDLLDEHTESVELSFGALTNALAAASGAATQILDDDLPSTVTISFETDSTTEGSSAPIALIASLDKPSGKNITVDIDFGGSARGNGLDYFAHGSQLELAPGENSSSLDIEISDDSLAEGTEDILAVALQTANAEFNAENSTPLLELLDNDESCNFSDDFFLHRFKLRARATLTPEQSIYSSDPEEFDRSIMGRGDAAIMMRRAEAVAFFGERYGVEFGEGEISTDGNFALKQVTLNSELTELRLKIRKRLLAQDEQPIVYAGYWQMEVLAEEIRAFWNLGRRKWRKTPTG